MLNYYHGPFGYFSPISRATNFLSGALLAALVMDPVVLTLLQRRRWLVDAAFVAVASTWTALVYRSGAFLRIQPSTGPDVSPSLGRLHALLLASFGYHASAGLSLLIALALLCGVLLRPHGALARALAWMQDLGPLTWRAYLIHIPLMFWLEAGLLPPGALRRLSTAAPLSSLGLMIAGVILAALAASVAWHVAVRVLQQAVWEPVRRVSVIFRKRVLKAL